MSKTKYKLGETVVGKGAEYTIGRNYCGYYELKRLDTATRVSSTVDTDTNFRRLVGKMFALISE